MTKKQGKLDDLCMLKHLSPPLRCAPAAPQEIMALELEKLETGFNEVRDMQVQVKQQYEAMLAYFGENLNSMPSGAARWLRGHCSWQ